MEHAAQPGIVAHDLQAVAVRLAVVDDDGLSELPRQRDLLAEEQLLLLLVLGVPVVVEADLPDGDALRVLGERGDLREDLGRAVLQLLGVDAHGGVDEVVALGQGERRAAAGQIAARVHDQRDAGRVRRLQQREAVCVEGAVVVMGMGVEIHGQSPSPFFYSIKQDAVENKRKAGPLRVPLSRIVFPYWISSRRLAGAVSTFLGSSSVSTPSA